MTERRTPGGRCILLIEDDDDTRESLRYILESKGYVVVEAAHARHALEWLADNTVPCLILLDLMMPVMNGLEFLDVLRRDPRHAKTPVVLISAWPREAAQVSGVQGWVKKPFDLEQLFASIHGFCSDAPSA